MDLAICVGLLARPHVAADYFQNVSVGDPLPDLFFFVSKV